jgi:hypothetical protein
MGPEEFVKLFRCASFALTDSFHGTAFSINMEIPFSTIMHTAKSMNRNSRMATLLTKLSVEHRAITSNYVTAQTDLGIDYNNVNRLLSKERKNSERFLEAALINC